MQGYLRSDGRKGIRNLVVIAYLVECAHHVARNIGDQFKDMPVQVIGFGGCYPNDYAGRMMKALCVHPNVGAVLLVSLGCESFDRSGLAAHIAATGRPVHTIVIQQSGGTKKSISEGERFVNTALNDIKNAPLVAMQPNEVIVGTICGGSDGTSGITANPAVGKALDQWIADGGTAVFEETGELIGLENIMAGRAATPALGIELRKSVEKAAQYYTTMGHGSFAPGNAEGGLTTIEEKSMGAYCKSGNSPISGMIRPGEPVTGKGLYLLDIVPDGEPLFGFPNINDNAEIIELIACGCHVILFTTGRGSVVGSAISPVIKICANPETYRRLEDDMDINAGKILTGTATIDDIAGEIVDGVREVAAGRKTCSEELGHQEFVLTYKKVNYKDSPCLPG